MSVIEQASRSFATFRDADAALRRAARFWFVTMIVGQTAFSAYVVAFYTRSALTGRLGDRSLFMAHGYIAGDTAGNVAAAAHIVLAAFVNLSGALQLVPAVRSRMPTVHRWNGRLYLGAAVAIALAGLYMIWFRGAVGDFSQHLGSSLDALLIAIFAVLALRSALARRFADHRRWALRLFMAVSGVWFFRIGFMLWMLVNRRAVGFDPNTFTGPFITVLAFAEYLVPLAALEVYLRVESRGASARSAAAVGLVVLTIVMGVGIAGAFVAMWLPNM